MTIPIGTLCYIVRAAVGYTPPEYIGRVVTVVERNCSGKRCAGCPRMVCAIRFSDGEECCVQNWTPLRPITPPPETVTRDEREPAYG